MHEAPGLYPKVVELAQRLVDRGFTIYMPSLFGKDGRRFTPPKDLPYALSQLARACVVKEFTVWATGNNSPIVDWLRELAHVLPQRMSWPRRRRLWGCVLLEALPWPQSGDVRLDWATATETNNDFFLVEHSRDGVSFRTLAEMEGGGA